MALIFLIGAAVLAVVFDIEWLKKLLLVLAIPIAVLLFLSTAGVI